jgi:hypothetical protein
MAALLLFVPGSQVMFGSHYLHVPAGVQATAIHELGLRFVNMHAIESANAFNPIASLRKLA